MDLGATDGEGYERKLRFVKQLREAMLSRGHCRIANTELSAAVRLLPCADRFDLPRCATRRRCGWGRARSRPPRPYFASLSRSAAKTQRKLA